MNGRQLADAQISQALRAHLPDGAQAGLQGRIFEAMEHTSQQRPLPSLLGALTDADPTGRRRSLLVAAAMLVALALAATAAVGALRLLERDPLEDLSLEPPADVQAFVLSSYERLPQLPPVALTWHDSDSSKGRIYVHRSGAVRFDRFASVEATEPSSSTILSGDRVSGMAHIGSGAVWVNEGDPAIGDDPRVFLRTVLRAEDGPPGCEMERDPSEVGNGIAAAGWRYVGTEYIAGRPTHHVACVGDIWLDIETRLILRSREPLSDDAGRPIPGQFRTTEVTEIAFGEQPTALFEAPEGVTHMSSDAYSAYLCTTRDLPNEQVVGLGARSECAAPPRAEASPLPTPIPTPSVRPSPSDCAIPSRDPGDPAGPLAWTQASLQRDWPAPVRPEPAGGASALPMPRTYIDPLNDTGSDVLPCIDIRDLTVDTHDVFLDLASNRPPDVEPSEAWIAYGVVVDDDRDGVPDWRYGIDNLPRTAGDASSHHREWRTDLDTGRTEWAVEKDFAMYFATGFATGYPGDADREGFRTGRDGARFRFGHVFDTTGGTKTRGFKVDMPLYAWASLIVDGRVVATDYAPDTGWLLPSPGANPGGTYVVHVDARLPRLSMEIPNGWTAPGSDSQVSDGRPWGDSVGLDLMIIDKPGLNACGSRGTALATIGRSADDLAAFLAHQPEIKVSQSTDVTLDGYRGRYLEYTTSDQNDCDPDNRPFWPVITNSGGGRGYHQVWILDVDGVRLVIDGFAPKASETVKAKLRQIVESIHIGP